MLAVADGVVERVGTLPISRQPPVAAHEAGDAFFYAHLSAFSPDAVNGRKVKAGTVLGFTGNTGDAEPTPPHVHFEIHPGGKDAIDPHAILLGMAGEPRRAPRRLAGPPRRRHRRAAGRAGRGPRLHRGGVT